MTRPVHENQYKTRLNRCEGPVITFNSPYNNNPIRSPNSQPANENIIICSLAYRMAQVTPDFRGVIFNTFPLFMRNKLRPVMNARNPKNAWLICNGLRTVRHTYWPQYTVQMDYFRLLWTIFHITSVKWDFLYRTLHCSCLNISPNHEHTWNWSDSYN
jgi:hypothetical protein